MLVRGREYGRLNIKAGVFDGLDVVFDVQNVEVDATSSKPKEDVIIESMTVTEYDGGEVRWDISDYNK